MIGPPNTGTYHCAARCGRAPEWTACGNAARRSNVPTTVHAQARALARLEPRCRPTKAKSARLAVRESPTAVARAKSRGMPGERFGTSSPRPSTRNICGATHRERRAVGDSRRDAGQTTNQTTTDQTRANQKSWRTKYGSASMSGSPGPASTGDDATSLPAVEAHLHPLVVRGPAGWIGRRAARGRERVRVAGEDARVRRVERAGAGGGRHQEDVVDALELAARGRLEVREARVEAAGGAADARGRIALVPPRRQPRL